LTLVGTTGLALLGTIALAQSVTYDFDKAADFTRMKTYAWTRGTELRDELNHKRVVSAIEAQLAAKGLTRVEADGKADLLVAYHASFDTDLEINGSGWGGYRFGPGRVGTARVEEIVIGSLVVELADGKTHTLVWRGIATKELDPKAKPEKREKNINKAAEKLFKNYPPTS
jgi:hypothetical protein